MSVADPGWLDWLQGQYERALLALAATRSGPPHPGLDGRSLGGPIRFRGTHRLLGGRDSRADMEADAGAWLRIVTTRLDAAPSSMWDGNAAADRMLQAAVARPAVLDVREWAADGRRIRAEVMTAAPSPALSTTLTPGPSVGALDARWWRNLQSALSHLAVTPTERVCLTAEHLAARLEWLLGPGHPLVGVTPEWSTAHGDLHWANLTGGPGWLLDWEGWGRGPAGYDVAHLYAVSLTNQPLAEQIEHRFADELSPQTRLVAQIAASVKVAQLVADGYAPSLRAPLTRHLAGLRTRAMAGAAGLTTSGRSAHLPGRGDAGTNSDRPGTPAS